MKKKTSTSKRRTPVAVGSDALVRRVALLENALQVIMDETQEHFEWNPESKTARLPNGYRKILNTAHAALNAPNNPVCHGEKPTHE